MCKTFPILEADSSSKRGLLYAIFPFKRFHIEMLSIYSFQKTIVNGTNFASKNAWVNFGHVTTDDHPIE
jgi:hypothetical protein